MNAEVNGAWVVVIAIFSHFTAIGDFLVNANPLHAPVHSTGVSLHAIGIRLTVGALSFHADRPGATHGVIDATGRRCWAILAFGSTCVIGADRFIAI